MFDIFLVSLNASASEPITGRTGLVTSGDVGPSLDCKGQSLSFFSVLRLEMLRVSTTSGWVVDGWSTTITPL